MGRGRRRARRRARRGGRREPGAGLRLHRAWARSGGAWAASSPRDEPVVAAAARRVRPRCCGRSRAGRCSTSSAADEAALAGGQRRRGPRGEPRAPGRARRALALVGDRPGRRASATARARRPRRGRPAPWASRTPLALAVPPRPPAGAARGRGRDARGRARSRARPSRPSTATPAGWRSRPSTAPASVTLSGERAALERVAGALARDGRALRLPAGGRALPRAADGGAPRGADAPRSPGSRPGRRRRPMLSTVTGRRGRRARRSTPPTGGATSAGPCGSPTRSSAPGGGRRGRCVVEVGPHPVLAPRSPSRWRTRAARRPCCPRCGAASPSGGRCSARSASCTRAAAPVDWAGVNGDGGRLVALPAYPWRRRAPLAGAGAPTARPRGGGSGGSRRSAGGCALGAPDVGDRPRTTRRSPISRTTPCRGAPAFPATGLRRAGARRGRALSRPDRAPGPRARRAAAAAAARRRTAAPLAVLR